MANRINIAGLWLDPITKDEFLKTLQARMETGTKTFITTLYSEFLLAALRDQNIMDLLNTADLAIADGVGIIWANRFLSLPLRPGLLGRFQAWGQMVYSGAQILLQPQTIYRDIPEKIVGAELIWDLAKFARDNHRSVYLLGWYDQGTEKVKAVFEKTFPGINVVGNFNGRPAGLDSILKKAHTKIDLDAYSVLPPDDDIVTDINRVQPDLLLVGFGYLKQEAWLAKHMPSLHIKAAIGLGGSFDYVIGKTVLPPAIVRKAGLEWLFRLVTQPARFKRIINATFTFVLALINYKVRQVGKTP